MMGGGWRMLDIVDVLEQDLEVPVLHTVPARVWHTQRHFMVGEKRTSFGRLLAELPPLLAVSDRQRDLLISRTGCRLQTAPRCAC